MRTQWKFSSLQPRSPSPKSSYGLLSFQNYEKCLLFISCPVFGILLWQLEWTKNTQVSAGKRVLMNKDIEKTMENRTPLLLSVSRNDLPLTSPAPPSTKQKAQGWHLVCGQGPAPHRTRSSILVNTLFFFLRTRTLLLIFALLVGIQ